MRRISKPWPPANVSSDGRAPCTMSRAEQANALAAIDPLPQFVSIRVAWLRRMLGRGR
jgi:hypothetical protein